MESNIAHTYQVYTGLCMLRDMGIINLELIKGNEQPANSSLIRLEMDHKQVCIDLSDSCEFRNNEWLSSSDLYFKRMLLKENVNEKIRPFGLNYPVLYSNDNFVARGYALSGLKGGVRSLARRNPILSSILDINIAHKNSSVSHFERLPLLETDNMRVIFYSRLWNPDKVNDNGKKNQRMVLNDIRIKAVSLLKKELGNRFIGGIQRDEYSEKVAGESLVQDNSIVHKKAYMANLRKSHIGIATEGLEESIGFKFAEYISMSMAIVSNSLESYSLPGSLSANKNYLSYETAEACVSECFKLMEDKNRYFEMCMNNMQYYNNFLSPDKLMLNCLMIAINT